MDKTNERILTGEIGFCPQCGGTVDVKILPQDRLQARITAAVARRGYREGWGPGQFLARQLAKLGEEYAEAYACLDGIMPVALRMMVEVLGNNSRFAFDHGYWADMPLQDADLRRLASELADMQVVLANAASAIEELLAEPVDLMRMACEKAEGDVERGVRK